MPQCQLLPSVNSRSKVEVRSDSEWASIWFIFRCFPVRIGASNGPYDGIQPNTALRACIYPEKTPTKGDFQRTTSGGYSMMQCYT